MGRKIILLSDGTGNSSAKVWRTNVWRTFEALDLSGSDQVAYYDDGVGTSSFKPMAILGGVFGFGLKRNVLALYKFACRNYRGPTDEFFAFGFSRGAFTIRIVMGLIANQGLVQTDSESELNSLAKAAYRAYRKERYPNLRLERPWQFVRNLFGPRYDKLANCKVDTIRFIGVWDTVSAYGMPIKEMNDGIHRYLWPIELPNRQLSDKVTFARQALSLDEERSTFHPQLWEEDDINVADRAGQDRHVADERLCQVWFAGVHSNVGGGYPDDSLAYIPFVWMIQEAERCGLRFKSDNPTDPQSPVSDPDTFKNAISKRDKDGRLYDPRKGMGGYYRLGPRKLVPKFYPEAAKNEGDEVAVSRAKIHQSVFRRIGNRATTYAPVGLPPVYDVVNDDGSIETMYQHGFETVGTAAARAETQEWVWNEIWKRRIVYFLTLGVTAWLLIFPFISTAKRLDEVTSPWRWISDLVRFIGAFLPGFARSWINGYAHAPESFLVIAGVLGGLLYAGLRLARSSNDMMSAIWRKAPDALTSPPTDWIYRLRSARAYKALLNAWSDGIAPILSAAAILYFSIAIFSHMAFNVQDVRGWTCKETPKGETISLVPDQTLVIAKQFNTASFCHATGVMLKANARYGIVIRPGPDWFDGTIPVKPGDSALDQADTLQKALFYAALPLRRALFEHWFAITLRYGAIGGEESFYYADPNDPVIQFPLKPTRDGELFMFVNDAVLGFPMLYDFFYRNNRGTATIELTLKK